MIIAKIKNKGMRLVTRFQTSRQIAISLKKDNPKLKRTSKDSFHLDVNKFVDEINQKGFSSTFHIPSKSLTNLVDYCNSSEFEGQNSKAKVRINYKKPVKPVNQEDLWYLNTEIYKECQEANDLAHHEDLVNIAAQYLGKEPKLFNVHAWWSFPPNTDDYVHNYGYHYDIDSVKFVKFFIYLTDVDLDSGPHVIVANTHKKKTWFQKRNRRLSEDQAVSSFPKEDINIMTGKAGEGFFEDTFAYHKGTTPKKPRLIFQVEYSI